MKKVSVEIKAQTDQAIKAIQNFGKAIDDVGTDISRGVQDMTR